MNVVDEVPTSFQTTARRSRALGLLSEAARETWSRRRLIRYLLHADLRKKGADTLLGNTWWVLDPLLQMAVYVVLVSLIFQRAQPDYPLFIFAAILPWKWFSSSIGDAIGSVVGVERLIKQIKFPKIVLPVAATVAGIVNMTFGLLPLAGLLVLFYADRISPFLVLIPLIAAVQFVFTLALAVLLSAINVFYRDVGNVSRHALRLWFYLSPALYSLDQVRTFAQLDPLIVRLMTLNPFAVLFEAYRAVIYHGMAPDWPGLIALFTVSLGLLALTTVLFKRVEPAFAKVL